MPASQPGSASLLEAAGAPCLSSHLLNLHTAKLQKILRPLGYCCLLEFGNIFSQEFIPTKSVIPTPVFYFFPF